MKISVNGQDVVLEKELSVKELLNGQKVEMQEYVTVQVNDEIVDKEGFAIPKRLQGLRKRIRGWPSIRKAAI